ncbi:MAG: hypothetical protein LQ350_007198 [Teloschistes chrysophthalmus]|nr:MAG: hypothetical protein LQ350_007198 [Niorma chrysophthalma]
MTLTKPHENSNQTTSAPADGSYTAETYTRKADHTPQTAQSESETYVLSLATDAAHHQAMTALRNKYFPPKLNKLSAHVALFRALPGSELPKIEESVQKLVRYYQPFPIIADDPFKLSHGIGVEVRAPPARTIYSTLKEQWNNFLSKQDLNFKPHYTIQNKVDDEEMVRKAFEQVRSEFGGSTGTVTGLSLYLYDRGFWRLKKIYSFGQQEEHQQPSSAMDNLQQDNWPALPKAGSST